MAASIPVSGTLLTALVAATIPRSATLHRVSVHPRKGNRIDVRAKLPHVEFLPPLTVGLEIERQPELPDSPLVLRLLSFPGLTSAVGAALPLASLFPAGIRMEKNRIYVDLRTLLEGHGYGDLLSVIEKVRFVTDEGRLIVELDVRVRAVPPAT